MAEYKFERTTKKKLAALLADKFVECAVGFNNGTWKPHWGGERSTVNFLKFNNGKRIGTQGFMRSVALESKIFLQGMHASGTGFYRQRYKSEYDEFNKHGDMRILQLNIFTIAMREIAEKLLKDNARLLPDSMTITSISTYPDKIFTGGTQFNDWGDSPLKKQATLNATNTSTETHRTYNEPPEHTERRARLAKVWSRPNQKNFSNMIRAEYKGTCIITGCTTQTALEAAHIKPVRHKGGDTLENGLLLRADLHLLFDAYLMAIDPATGEVHFKETDKNYDKYTHAKIPDNDKLRENLTAHWETYDK